MACSSARGADHAARFSASALLVLLSARLGYAGTAAASFSCWINAIIGK